MTMNDNRPGLPGAVPDAAEVPAPRPHGDDLGAQLARRRAAAQRCLPLDTGRGDPLHRADTLALSVESARATWSHLVAHGLMSDVVAAVLIPGQREAP